MDGRVIANGRNDPVNNVHNATQATEKVLITSTSVKGFTVTAATGGLTSGEKTSFWLVEHLKASSKKWFTHIFLTICLILYSVLGAVIFMNLEGSHEKKRYEVEMLTHRYRTLSLSTGLRKDFVENMTWICKEAYKPDDDDWDYDYYNIDFNKLIEDQLLDYEKRLKDYHKYLGEDEPPAYKKTWKFWNSMLYAATIYSTIGYGHIAPKTASGRAATIIYAIIGIPLFLIVLTDFGKLLTRGLKYSWVVTRICCKTKNKRKSNQRIWQSSVRRASEKLSDIEPSNGANGDQHEVNPGEDPSHIKPGTAVNKRENEIAPEEIDDNFDLPVSVALTLLTMYLFIGAALFTLMEDWTYSQSFYFTFISMSTIGLGDFVPADPMYMMALMFYLIFGLALTAMCINVVQNKLNETFKEARRKLGAKIGLTIDEDENLEIKTSPGDNSEIPV